MAAGTLKQTIRGMLKDARQTPGLAIERSLAGVFTLSITQLGNGRVQVELMRTNQAPTTENWAHVLEQWPETVLADERSEPRPRTESRRHALTASWPRPAELTENA